MNQDEIKESRPDQRPGLLHFRSSGKRVLGRWQQKDYPPVQHQRLEPAIENGDLNISLGGADRGRVVNGARLRTEGLVGFSGGVMPNV